MKKSFFQFTRDINAAARNTNDGLFWAIKFEAFQLLFLLLSKGDDTVGAAAFSLEQSGSTLTAGCFFHFVSIINTWWERRVVGKWWCVCFALAVSAPRPCSPAQFLLGLHFRDDGQVSKCATLNRKKCVCAVHMCTHAVAHFTSTPRDSCFN